jgi:hypothetical protein
MKRGRTVNVRGRRRSGSVAIRPMATNSVATAVMEALGALVRAETHSRHVAEPLDVLACECVCTASIPANNSISRTHADAAQR